MIDEADQLENELDTDLANRPQTAGERLRKTLERMAQGSGGDAARAALALALWDNVGVPTRVQNLISQMGHEGGGTADS